MYDGQEAGLIIVEIKKKNKKFPLDEIWIKLN